MYVRWCLIVVFILLGFDFYLQVILFAKRFHKSLSMQNFLHL